MQNHKNSHHILVVFATHTSTPRKLKTAKQTISYLKQIHNINIHVINSKNLPFNDHLVSFYNEQNVNYTETENDGFYDFGKWIKILNEINYSQYKFIMFVNDSIIITNKINHFVAMATKEKKELYGYNSSSQLTYHYQSYLFIIKEEAIEKFIYFFNASKHLIHSFDDVIANYELKMAQYFTSKSCFLDIANLNGNENCNIFFTNDKLYSELYKNNLLPFIKIKRLP